MLRPKIATMLGHDEPVFMELKVRILSSTNAMLSGKTWPLRVHRCLTFGDLTAILQAQFSSLRRPLLFFHGARQVGVQAMEQVVASTGLVPEREVLLVQEGPPVFQDEQLYHDHRQLPSPTTFNNTPEDRNGGSFFWNLFNGNGSGKQGEGEACLAARVSPTTTPFLEPAGVSRWEGYDHCQGHQTEEDSDVSYSGFCKLLLTFVLVSFPDLSAGGSSNSFARGRLRNRSAPKPASEDER